MRVKMKHASTHNAIFVLTGRGLETMLNEGGSQAWVIDAKRAKNCEYVVCIQNHNQNYFSKKQLSAAHHTAFVVGKLIDIVPADPGASDENRKKLVFSEYAIINMKDKWPKNRNPVFYDSLSSFGIDVEKLVFKPMPQIEALNNSNQDTKALTISQAKIGLALNFGISPDDIEIVIRG